MIHKTSPRLASTFLISAFSFAHQPSQNFNTVDMQILQVPTTSNSKTASNQHHELDHETTSKHAASLATTANHHLK